MRNPTYETELTKQGVQWEYLPTITLDFVNTKKSLANQARLEKALDEPTVEQYTAAYKDGAEFPPLVVHRPGKGQFILLDGNQRYAAATKASLKKHDAYRVDSTDPMVLDRIAWSFNNHVNGLRLTQEECLEHAVTFVNKYGMSQEAAAKEWGVPKWRISRRCVLNELRDKLGEYKVKVGPAVTDEVLHSLQVLRTYGDDVLIPAIQAISETGMLGTEVRDMLKNIKDKTTQQGRLNAIEEFKSSETLQTRKAETKGGMIRRPSPLPRDRLQKLVNETIRLLDLYPDGKAFLPGNKTETKQMRQDVAAMVHQLGLIFGLGIAWQALPQEEGVA